MSSRPVPGPPARTTRFYLESLVEGGRQLRRIAVFPLPFRVGRLPGLALSLASESVSKEHAELVREAIERATPCLDAGYPIVPSFIPRDLRAAVSALDRLLGSAQPKEK